MRILKLSIEHVRGIHDMVLEPRGENLAIWGPNGSGKSAVVDALDFLLTGEISRLTGRGAGALSLKSHGPHVDHKAADARVTAEVSLAGIAEPIELARCMKAPKELEYDEAFSDVLEPIIHAASQHQHVLARRELLRFITAEPASRAEEIQNLLSLAPIEKTRSTLVSLRNGARKDREAEEKGVDKAKSAVAATAQLDTFDSHLLLETINKCRAVLGAEAITELDHENLLVDLALPKPKEGTQSINVTALKATFTKLAGQLPEDGDNSLPEADKQLRILLSSIRSDEIKRLQAARLNLYKAGLPLVPESGECPLCETEWSRGVLSKRIQDRIEQAELATSELKEAGLLADEILKRAGLAIPAIDRIVAALDSVGMAEDASPLREWRDRLEGLQTSLRDPLGSYPAEGQTASSVAGLLAEPNFGEELSALLKRVSAEHPAASPEQVALGTLTQLEVSLRSLEERKADLEVAERSEAQAVALHDSFISARDEILGGLYSEICERFIQLYSELHSNDEGGFNALLEPDGAGLRLEVDFFGRGEHPPHALHSEGHQDSMGLCLYLALAEHLVGDVIKLTILDDVVMSVDSEHRRGVCEALKKHFPDRQFLITTHDKTWMNQLRTTGVVARENIWEFFNWDIDTGPHVALEPDLWSRVDERLGANDVNLASSLLRRGSEQFFSLVCDCLETPVRFSLEGKHDLGDLLPAAIGQLNRDIKAAMKAARSWGDTDALDRLKEFRSTVGQVVERTDMERWPVNPSVHFSAWENFTKQDFIPVKEAFQDLHGLFVCQNPKCGSILRVEKKGMVRSTVRCSCGDIFWNLETNKGKAAGK